MDMDSFAFYRVLTLVRESVEFNHQSPLLVEAQDTAFRVVFGTNEDSDGGVNSLVRSNVDFVREGLVVHAELSGLDDEFFFRFVQVYSVADVKIELLEVGNELFNIDGFDLDAGEDKFFTEVFGHQRLVTEEETVDSGQKTVVDWVTENSLEVLSYAGNILVAIDAAEDLERQVVKFSVEVVVDRVNGRFDKVSNVVHTAGFGQLNLFTGLSEDESEVNSVTNARFKIFNQLDFIFIDLGKVSVVSTDGELNTIGVTKVWVVSLFNGQLVVNNIDIEKIVGETFKDVTSQELLVSVVEKFTTTFGLVSVGGVHPEGAVQVKVVVVSVEGDVFGEVSKAFLSSAVVKGVVTVNVALVGVVFFVVNVVVIRVETSLVDGNNDDLAEFRHWDDHTLFQSLLYNL